MKLRLSRPALQQQEEKHQQHPQQHHQHQLQQLQQLQQQLNKIVFRKDGCEDNRKKGIN